jgi:GT2 family glycosyltransferase
VSESIEISVVIPSWNTRELTLRCLATLRAADAPASEVVLVDNGSQDGSADAVAERFPEVRLIRNAQNEGFARACNQGIRAARGRYLFLLNTDTEVFPDALRRLWRFLEEHSGHAAVAPRLVHADGRTQRTCMAFPRWSSALFFSTPCERWFPDSRELCRYFLRDWDHESSRDVDQPPAAALLVRKSVLDALGAFDEELWLFFNDVDLLLRMRRAGWKTHYLAEARVVHHVGASTSQFARFAPEWHRNRLAYFRKNHGRGTALWVKLCSTLAFLDYGAGQSWKRLRGRPHESVAAMAREWWSLVRGGRSPDRGNA